MFGSKPKSGAVKRSAYHAQNAPLIPHWLRVVLTLMVGLAVFALLVLWRPWQPINRDAQNVGLDNVTLRDTPIDQYDFYSVLPKQQVTPVPQTTLPADAKNQTVKPETTDSNVSNENNSAATVYILQIGSFQDPDDADQLKSKALFTGVNVDIKLARSAQGDLWYRVIAGPYHNHTLAVQAQQRLQAAAIDSIVVQQN